MIIDDGNWISRQSGNDNSECSIIPVSRDFNCFTRGDSGTAGHSESRESLYWKSWIGCRATHDELGGNGEDFIDTERGIECAGDGIALVGSEEVSVVTGFNGENGACCGEIIFVGN